MAGGMNERRLSIDPHGYQPILIDEECLADEDRKDALLATVHSPCDWRRQLTPHELKTLTMALDEIEKNRSPYFYSSGELPEMDAKRFEFARLGTFRAYAREKYSPGNGIWYGDGLPFHQA